MFMKIQRTFIVIPIMMCVLFANYSTALAVPPFPSSFYGTAKVDGMNVPVGAPITAFINGVQVAFSGTSLYEGETVYSLDVPGDDPTTPAIEGGVAGDTIVFLVNGQPAQQTALWQSGSNLMLDLTIPPQTLLFMPAIYK